MRTHEVAVLAGDGIGPEVMAQALRVLDAAGGRFGFAIAAKPGLIGRTALSETGRVLPGETMLACRAADAVLVGPIAGDVACAAHDINHPKQGLIKLRAWLGSFATVRPIRTFAALDRVSPLEVGRGRPDLVVVHDHSSGIFYGRPHEIVVADGVATATNTTTYTSGEVARTARLAFEVAAGRRGHVVSVDMAKLLETGQLWAETVAAVGVDHPGVRLSRRDAQHFFYEFPAQVADYDVLLAEMSLGQLIAATAAGLTGTFAIHPAAYLGGHVPLFQPSHGAALQLAGRGEADPLGMIRAAAMMLANGINEPTAAAAIEAAVEAVLLEVGWPGEIMAGKAGDLRCRGSDRLQLSTAEVGDAVLHQLTAIRPAAAPARDAA